MVRPVLIDELARLPGIAHGFFTRHGGVSQGIYASLNCGIGSKESSEAVAENRARALKHLGARRLATPHQVHSATAVVVDDGSAADWRPRADAVVTATPGIAVAVLTADCAPILLADPEAGVIGAAHAGWRGAHGGIAEAAIAAMEGLGAERRRIHAAVGPCIGRSAYEVGPEFEAEFLSQSAENAQFFTRERSSERPHFDLSGYVAARLQSAGLATVGATRQCTFTDAKDFFSYRRSQRQGEPDYGRQLSAIVLT